MKVTDRPSWDEYFLMMAVIASSRGTCDRLRTGCLFVKGHRIVASGYNGSVSDTPSCDEAGHLMVENHCIRTLHGEENAILNAVTDLKGASAYIIGTPCTDCVKRMLQAGVKRIVVAGTYSNAKNFEFSQELVNAKKAEFVQYCTKPEDLLMIFAKMFSRLRGPGGIFKDVKDPNVWSELAPPVSDDHSDAEC